MRTVKLSSLNRLLDWKNATVKRKVKRTLQAFLLLSPALAVALIFIYYPAIYTLKLSFFDWDLISPEKVFVGTGNYHEILAFGSDFWKSVLITMKYSLIYTLASILLGMVIATALNKTKFLNRFFQSLYFIPSVTSISVISVVWSLIFNPQIGPLNQFMEKLGVPAAALPQWLNDPQLAIIVLALIGIWQSLGYTSLLLLAGLRNIPGIFYEAAAIDGADQWQILFYITIPLLSPILFFVIFMLTINSFQVFAIVSIMTQGRPLGSTNVVLYYIYQEGFRFFHAGTASAASAILFMIIFFTFMLQKKLGERNVFYQ